MAHTKMMTERPFVIAIQCKQLRGKEHDGHTFDKGIYVSMIAASNQRQVMKKALESIASITELSVTSLDCEVLDVREISLEEANSYREIMKFARPDDEIKYH